MKKYIILSILVFPLLSSYKIYQCKWCRIIYIGSNPIQEKCPLTNFKQNHWWIPAEIVSYSDTGGVCNVSYHEVTNESRD